MPDPFSIALGVVQIADTGFKLAETIYAYTNSVRKAEKQLEPIANYVKLTSTVLQQVASHLRDEDMQSLYKPALLDSADEALKGCERAFGSLDVFMKTLIKDGNNGEQGIITTKTKITWLWKQKEIDGYQIHLERYKSTFDLLLNTLIFVNSSRTTKDTLTMKLELQRLMNAETEAKKKKAEFDLRQVTDQAGKFSTQENSQHEISRDLYNRPGPILTNNIATTPFKSLGDGRPLQESKGATSPSQVSQSNFPSNDRLLCVLRECVCAVEDLAATLKYAIEQRENSQDHNPTPLLYAFDDLHDAIRRVTRREETLRAAQKQDQYQYPSSIAASASSSVQAETYRSRYPPDLPIERKTERVSLKEFWENEDLGSWADFLPNQSAIATPGVISKPIVNAYVDVRQEDCQRSPSSDPRYQSVQAELPANLQQNLPMSPAMPSSETPSNKQAEATQQPPTTEFVRRKRTSSAIEISSEPSSRERCKLDVDRENRLPRTQLFGQLHRKAQQEEEIIIDPNLTDAEELSIKSRFVPNHPDVSNVDELLKKWTLIAV